MGATNTDRGHRRAHGHGIGAGLGDRAADETLDHRERGRALVGFGVENQFVQHHPAFFADGEGGVVDERDFDRAAGFGLQDIALVDR